VSNLVIEECFVSLFFIWIYVVMGVWEDDWSIGGWENFAN